MRLAKDQEVGPWRLRRRLGHGGNAEVWRAERGEEVVALKVLRHASVGSEPYRRFQAETSFLRSHGTQPGILPLLDAHLPDRPSADDRPWLSMPVAKPIRRALGERPKLSVVVEAVADIAETLADLAERGIGHRDIKPDNLFRLGDRWVVGDFGLVSYPGKEAVTRGRGKLGPMYFIAPEMLQDAASAKAGPADVYSLAKTLWVLATGQNYPPPGEQRLEHADASLQSWTAEPRIAPLDRLIERCTNPDPDARPAMSAVVDELRAWLAPSPAPREPEALDDLAERLRQADEPAIRRQQLRAERSKELEQTWQRMTSLLASIQEALAGTFSFVGMDGQPQLFQGWGLDIPLVSAQDQRAAGVICRSADTDPVELHLAVGVRWLEESDLQLAAAVRVEDRYAGSVTVWSHTWEAALGSARLDRALASMADGLRSQLRPGLDRAVARVELRLDRDRYAAWGQMGTGPGQLQSPWSVFSSLADEGCYVVDTYNNRVQRFGPGGRPIPFGPDGQRKGSDLGEFDFPTGGCVDFDGNLWVADQGNRRLQQFTPTGELIGISGWHGAGAGSVKGPCDVACDPAGSHYVVDREAHKVFRGRGTAITAEWGGQGREPGKLETPCGIAIRHGAYVYVSDSGNNRIQKFTAEGELVDCWGGLGSAPGRFRAPHGIALDGDENVFVADSENHRIQQFTSTGELVRRWGAGGGDGTSGSGQGQFIQPRGVSVDGVGNVYVCEFGSSRIQRFGRDYVAAL